MPCLEPGLPGSAWGWGQPRCQPAVVLASLCSDHTPPLWVLLEGSPVCTCTLGAPEAGVEEEDGWRTGAPCRERHPLHSGGPSGGFWLRADPCVPGLCLSPCCVAVLLRTPEGGRGRWPLPGGSVGCAQQARSRTSRGSRRGRGRVWASQPGRWLWTRLPGCVMKAMHLVPALGSRSPGPSQDSLLWRSEWGLPGCGKKPVSCVHAGRPVGGRPPEALGTSFQQSPPGRRCPWATRAPPLLGDSAPWVVPKAEQALMVMGAKGTDGVPAPGLREGPTWVLQPVCSRGHP